MSGLPRVNPPRVCLKCVNNRQSHDEIQKRADEQQPAAVDQEDHKPTVESEEHALTISIACIRPAYCVLNKITALDAIDAMHVADDPRLARNPGGGSRSHVSCLRVI